MDGAFVCSTRDHQASLVAVGCVDVLVDVIVLMF